MLTECTSFPRVTILPQWKSLLLNAKLHASRKSYYNHISETKISFLIDLFTFIDFGKDSNDEVATEHLVDITFMPHNIPEIS